MRILVTLPLYVFGDLIRAFAMSLAIYTFVFLALMCSEIANNDVSMLTIIRVIPYIFPMISRLVLPISVITAILIAYGRFSANNELTAATASGIHPFWLGAPGLAIAFIAGIITVYLNADVMTASVVHMERRLLADRTHIINSKLEKPGSFSFQIPGSITLGICRLPSSWGANSSHTGIDFAVFKQPSPSTSDEMWDTKYPFLETRTLAKNHQIKVTDDEDIGMEIVADFWDAIVFNKLNKNLTSIQLTPHTRDKFTHPNQGMDVSVNSQRLQYMGIDKLKLLMERCAESLRNYREQQYRGFCQYLPATAEAQKRALPADVAALIVPADVEISADEIVRRLPILASEWEKIKTPKDVERFSAAAWLTDSIREVRKQAIAANAEINVKLVMSFSCISFAFLGIPLAMRGRCGNSNIGYAVGLASAFIFYMLISALFNAVRDQAVGWQILWLPNAVMLLVGVFLWHRIARGR